MGRIQFQHKRLNHHRQIRLLHRVAHPDNEANASTTTYHLQHTDLDNNNKDYIAVSYTWGKPDLEREIVISGKACLVTDSLYHAIQDVFNAIGGVIPDFGNKLPIWIDGLCIDQDSIEEKSEQVALMGEIYRNACLVVTHAAKEDVTNINAIHLIKFCHDFIARENELTPKHMSALRRNDSIEQFNFPSSGDECYHNLRNLVRLPWSGRAWIVQECVMAKNIILVLGKVVLQWTALAKVCAYATRGLLPMQCIYSQHDLEVSNIYGPANLMMLSGLRNEAWTMDGRLSKTLCQLLRRCHSFGSSDPRDKVYAFLGMAKDQGELDITPDYRKPVNEVYKDTAIRILTVGQNLDLLSSVRPDKAVKLPSWIPDWSSFNAVAYGPNNYLRNSELVEQGLYKAGGAQNPCITFSNEGNELTLRAIIFDHIHIIFYADCHGSLNPYYHEGHEAFDGRPNDVALSLLRNVQFIIETACDEACLKPYPSIKEAFWRTLIANVDDGEQEATPNFEANYDSYVTLQYANYSRKLEQDFVINEVAQLQAVRFASAMGIMSSQRAIGLTSNGYIASIPSHAEIGDLICVALGGRLPLIVRRESGESRYSLLGDCYTHGIMKGEAIECAPRGEIINLTFI